MLVEAVLVAAPSSSLLVELVAGLGVDLAGLGVDHVVGEVAADQVLVGRQQRLEALFGQLLGLARR